MKYRLINPWFEPPPFDAFIRYKLNYRLLCACPTVNDKVIYVEDVRRFEYLPRAMGEAYQIFESGDALYIEIYHGDKKITTLYRC